MLLDQLIIFFSKVHQYLHLINRLLHIADKYNVKGLIDFCEVELSKELNSDNAIKILDAADKVVEAKRLQQVCIQFTAENLASLMDTPDWKTLIAKNAKILDDILREKLCDVRFHIFFLNDVTVDGVLNWKIENFLTWSELQDDYSLTKSSTFTFKSSMLNKDYKFCLEIWPRGDKTCIDELGIFLRNENREKVGISYKISVGNKSTLFSTTKTFDANSSWGWKNFITRTELAANKDKYLPVGLLHIQCEFKVHEFKAEKLTFK